MAGASHSAEGQGAQRPSRLLTLLSLLSLYIIWGSTYLAIRWALEGGFPPFLMAGIRYVIAGVLLYVFLRVRGAPNPTRVQWLRLAAIGTLLLAGGNGGVTFAEQWVASGLAAVWIGSMPLWAALFSGLFGRWPVRVEWAGLALGFLGVVMLNLEGDFRANPIGAIALLISTICWAFGSIWSRQMQLPAGLMSSAGEMLMGGAVLLLLGLGTGEHFTTAPTWEGIGAVAYLVVFGSLVAFSAYLYLLRHVRSAMATSYAYVNPVVAVALGFLLAGEKIGWIGGAAMFVILGAVGLVAVARERH